MKKKLSIGLALSVLCVGFNSCDNAGRMDDYHYLNESAFMDGAISGDVICPDDSSHNQFEDYQDNPFVAVADQPTSTFSVDADGASFAVMRRFLSDTTKPVKGCVRIEEFLNYFTFDYPAPTGSDAIAINAEVGECPWNGSHQLLRLGIKGKDLPANQVPLANYVFLVDVSGSMDSSDKLDLLKQCLVEMLDQMKPDDRVSIVTYSGEVEKLLESTPISQADRIKAAIGKLSAEGATAGGEAMKMAYEEALANYDPKKNNRIIMGTDGDFNVGVYDVDSLVAMVEGYAKRGIYLTCLGFGSDVLNDVLMEHVSNAGNGTYYFIDGKEEMTKVFINERERFVSVANDTKCQVTFNPDYVSQYRLIGYENRVMNNEDFMDDTKDAGEIGAGQTITALYEIELTPEGSKWAIDSRTNHHVLATFDCRYKKALGESSLALNTDVAIEDMYESNMTPKPMSENLSFAAGVAAYGMLLRESPYKGEATFDLVKSLVKQSLGYDPFGYRAAFLELISVAEGL